MSQISMGLKDLDAGAVPSLRSEPRGYVLCIRQRQQCFRLNVANLFALAETIRGRVQPAP